MRMFSDVDNRVDHLLRENSVLREQIETLTQQRDSLIEWRRMVECEPYKTMVAIIARLRKENEQLKGSK